MFDFPKPILGTIELYMSCFWFAYNITHDIRIRALCIVFKKNLNVIPTFIFPEVCRNTYFLGKDHVLSNLLRWHPIVFRMTTYYVRTWTFQLDYVVDKSINIIYLYILC